MQTRKTIIEFIGKIMKKSLLLLSLILLPLAVSAVNLIDGIYYNLNSDTKTAEVVKYLSKKYSGDFVIPSSVTVEGIKLLLSDKNRN